MLAVHQHTEKTVCPPANLGRPRRSNAHGYVPPHKAFRQHVLQGGCQVGETLKVLAALKYA